MRTVSASRLLLHTLAGYAVLSAIFLAKPRIIAELLSGRAALSAAQVGVELAIDWAMIGVALVIGFALTRRQANGDPLDAAQRFAVRWGWAIVLGVWLPLTVLHGTGVVDGIRYFWAEDDQMISMLYARSLVEGHGLTWAGIRLEGYSNPLWVAWMSLVLALGVPDRIAPLVLLVSNVLLGGVLALASVRVARRCFGAGPFAMIATVLAVTLTPFPLGLARDGWEAVLLSILTLFAFARIVDERESGKPTATTALLLGVIALVRIDGMVISGVLGLAWWLTSRERLRAFAYGAAGALLPVAMFVFRRWYFGDWMPNTVYLKTTGWDGRWHVGLVYVVKFCVQMAPPLALAAWFGWRRRRFPEALALVLCAVMFAQVTYAGGDFYFNYRMLLPLVPFLFAMAFAAVESWSAKDWVRVASVPLMAVLCAGVFPGIAVRYGAIDERLLDDIRIANVLAPICGDERVAEFDAGVPFWYSRCKGIDFFGKIDRVIAHQHTVPGDQTPAHNKYDYDYSIGTLHPGFVIAPVDGFPDAARLEELRVMGAIFPPSFYANRFFVEHCRDHVVPSESTRKIYRCEWGGEPPGVRPAEWVE